MHASALVPRARSGLARRRRTAVPAELLLLRDRRHTAPLPALRAAGPVAFERVVLVVLVVLLGVIALAGWPMPSAQAADTTPPRVVYGLPVGGAVVDPYRPPSNPYGPGNRGVDLATTPGSPVGAPADGEVVFAGQVGGDLFVVILHADGVRTTLGYLATILVRTGQFVHAGQWVGTAGTSVHFGARVGTSYIDPYSLLAPQVPKVWLIPPRSG